MIHIRPHQIFSLSNNFDEPYVAFLPSNYSGGILVLESTILISLLKLINPTQIFEFGTYRGDTTRLLLENLSPVNSEIGRVYTLDLESTAGVEFQGDDKGLADVSVSMPRKYLSSKNKDKVIQIYQDSLFFDPKDYLKQFQYIFIDANHKYDYVKKDSENAFQMISDGESVIVWHDYGNPQFPELTSYLDALSEEVPLYHIEETMLVVCLSGYTIPEKFSGWFSTTMLNRE